jgi:adenosylcobinamide-phosphate synthase
MVEVVALVLGYALDILIGDPERLPHPVRIIGRFVKRIERFLKKRIEASADRSRDMTKSEDPDTSGKERKAGLLLVIIVVGTTYGIFYLISSILLSPGVLAVTRYLSLIVFVYLISTALATRELIKSARSVILAIDEGDTPNARRRLSHIVGRDTDSLDGKGILKATIETLAENASDGVIAPLFYFSIGGLPLAMTYKAINTLDSMIGYRNERYRNFGWAAARLDDIANFIPARITGILIVFACLLSSLFRLPSPISWRNAYRVMLRDGRNHLSPNSGIPEAAMAGGLGVQLGGPSVYGGMLVKKPYIGEEIQSTEPRAENPEHRTQSTESKSYLEAAEKAIAITGITSLLGLYGALAILYVRLAL